MNPEPRPAEVTEDECAACGAVLRDDEQGKPVCSECDWKLDRELAAWLSFVAVCRSE